MRVLFVDLNNFSRYPTLSVGYLTAVLRQQDYQVDVFSPLSLGIDGYPRLTRAKPWEYYLNVLKHWSFVTRMPMIRWLRRATKIYLEPGSKKEQELIVNKISEYLQDSPDIVLISAYTMFYEVCRDIAATCQDKNIPVLVGGNSFVVEEIAKLWNDIPGVNAIYAGEPEFQLTQVIEKIVKGEDVCSMPGVYSPDKLAEWVAEPLVNLDRVPFPDYSDFPWESYPNRIVPIMTGRGCQWGHCTFCADVVTSAGRTYRSRSLQNVIDEIHYQRQQHDANLFVFLDLKLNSDLEVWRGLIKTLPEIAPGAQWTASVHVDNRRDNGLSRADLEAAKAAGLTRITCGLESASPKLLAKMAKGMKPARLAQFIKDATEVGISVRLTAMIGYPGETPEDVAVTAEFVKQNQKYIERIVLNRFALMPNTVAEQRFFQKKIDEPGIEVSDSIDTHYSLINYENKNLSQRKYIRAANQLMAAIHRINRQELMSSAQEFEGVF